MGYSEIRSPRQSYAVSKTSIGTLLPSSTKTQQKPALSFESYVRLKYRQALEKERMHLELNAHYTLICCLKTANMDLPAGQHWLLR